MHILETSYRAARCSGGLPVHQALCFALGQDLDLQAMQNRGLHLLILQQINKSVPLFGEYLHVRRKTIKQLQHLQLLHNVLANSSWTGVP